MMEGFSYINEINEARKEFHLQSKDKINIIGYWLGHKVISVISLPANAASALVGIVGMAASACTLGALKAAIVSATLGFFKPEFSTGFSWFAEKTVVSIKELLLNFEEIVADSGDLIFNISYMMIKLITEAIKVDQYVLPLIDRTVDYFSQKWGTCLKFVDKLSHSIFEDKNQIESNPNLRNDEINHQLEGIENVHDFVIFATKNKDHVTKVDLSKFNDLVENDHVKTLIKNCAHLTFLRIKSSKISHESMREIGTLNKLKNLQLVECNGVNELDVSGLERLENIDLTCTPIKKLDGLNDLNELKSFVFGGCVLQQLDVSGLDNLELIYLSGSKIDTIFGLNKLKKLKSLDLSWSQSLKHLDLSGLKSLEKLVLNDASIENIEGLSKLKDLKEIELSSCQELEEIDLSGLQNLELLSLDESSIEIIKGLSEVQKLKKLGLKKCEFLKELDVSGLKSLEELNLSHTNIQNIKGFSLKNLKLLNFMFCKIKHLNVLGLPNLESLSLNSSSTEKIEGLNQLNKLKEIYLTSCKQLEEVDVFRA